MALFELALDLEFVLIGLVELLARLLLPAFAVGDGELIGGAQGWGR